MYGMMCMAGASRIDAMQMILRQGTWGSEFLPRHYIPTFLAEARASFRRDAHRGAASCQCSRWFKPMGNGFVAVVDGHTPKRSVARATAMPLYQTSILQLSICCMMALPQVGPARSSFGVAEVAICMTS